MAHAAILDETSRARVSAAVTAAEAKTAGEILTILTDRSSDYGDVVLVWSALVALLALAALAIAPDFYLALFDRLTGRWQAAWSPRAILELAIGFAVLKFGGVWLLLQWPPLRFTMVPRTIRHARVRERAISSFRIGAERRTHGRTGILIYLSMREHRAEIVADEAIVDKVDPAIWGGAMAAMLAELRRGRTADGLIAAVERVGAVLAEHCPRTESDINELPDRLIEI